MPLEPPALLTFDIFGTVVDWRTGLRNDLLKRGRKLSDCDFDRLVDAQGADEAKGWSPYREITARSLVSTIGLTQDEADAIGRNVGGWPAYPDSADALRSLMKVAPCVAMTNSDKAHGEQFQKSKRIRLSNWICAEDTKVYKPSSKFWKLVSKELSVPLDRRWWHVSAYADYDLNVARELGCTTVFVNRPHSRPGEADMKVADLTELANLLRPS